MLANLQLPAVLGACSCLQAAGCCTGSVPLGCRLQAAARVISEAVSSAGVFASPKAAAYWTYHLSRSSFFLLQGAAGELLALHTHDKLCELQGVHMQEKLLQGAAGEVLALQTHGFSFFLLQGAAGEVLLRASPGCPATCNPSTRVCDQRKVPRSACCGAGLLAARTTTTVTGKPEGGQGMRLERLLTSGLAGPVSEATAMFYQVRHASAGMPSQELVHLCGVLSYSVDVVVQ